MRSRFAPFSRRIVDSDTWIAKLPRSVEAIFYYASCSGGDSNTALGRARNCAEAEDFARAAHRKFEAKHGVAIPLLALHADNWEMPFVEQRV